MAEADRPTFNSLRYLTKVRPHHISRDPWIIDHWAHGLLSDLYGTDAVNVFGRYTRSLYTLDGHYQNLWLFDRPILPKPDDPDLDIAIAHTRKIFRLRPKVKSHGWYDLADVPFIPSSGAGYGYRGKKGDPGNHDKAISRAHYSLKWWLETIQKRTSVPFRFKPDLAWTRTGMAAFNEPKIRHVWGTAFENIILEGMSASPLILRYQQTEQPMVVGINTYKTIPSIISKALYANGEEQYGIGFDFTKFDSSLQPWLIDEVFHILEDNIEFPDYYSHMAFHYAWAHFIKRPVVMPDGRMWLKQVGLPSGSYFTQVVGSIANHIGISYAQYKIYRQFFDTWVLGDDSLFGQPTRLGPPDIDAFRHWLANLGLYLHTDKGHVATRPGDLDFLGHYARGMQVTRDTAELMRLILYPEHEIDCPATSYSRIKGMLVDSGLNSWPLIQLFRYAQVKYRELGNPELPTLAPDDANWLNAVIRLKVQPTDLDIIKAWTIT